MPIHDRSRVDDGVLHDFHCRWIVTLSEALNNGLLPPDFYAMAGRYDEGYVPDVLTLQASDAEGSFGDEDPGGGVIGINGRNAAMRVLADREAAPIDSASR